MGKSRLFITTAAVLAFCAAASVSAKAAELEVVASFSILEDLAKNVGGKRVNVSALVGRNADAHAYEAKPQDIAIVSKARVVLVNGLGYEGFIDRLITSSGTKATVVEASKGITPLPANTDDNEHHGHDEKKHGHDHDHKHDHAHHDHGAYDPHAWQAVENVIVYVENIREAFCTADKAGCATYTANAEGYTERLRELDKGIRLGISSLPENRRTVITSHGAFNYFGKAYGLTFLAPEGVSTHAEASAKDVADLIDQIKQQNVTAVFLENISNNRLMEQISSETGVKIGGKLFSDALTKADESAPDYLTMMRNNLATITLALQE